jgi:hypothetical protein
MDSAGPAHASEAAEKARSPRGPATDGLGGLEIQGQQLAASVALHSKQRQTPPANRNQVMALQRLAGNRAVARSLGTLAPAAALLQRHAPGTELPDKEAQVGEIQHKEQTDPVSAPQATRTKAEEETQKTDAAAQGKAFQKSQKLTPGAMSLAAAQKILQGQFGGTKDIVPGTIEILKDQPACAAKYDEVCIRDGVRRPDGSAWKAGDCAKDDAAAGVQTEGFAWKGVVYVNGKTTLVTATAHEILHNNTAGGYLAKVGATFDEGTTELLARRALKAAGVKVPSVTAYPDQVKFTEKLQKLVGEKVLETAYFSNPDSLITKFEELKGAGTWAAAKAAATALDEKAFKKALEAEKVK